MAGNSRASGAWRRPEHPRTAPRPAVILGNRERAEDLARLLEQQTGPDFVVTDVLDMGDCDFLSELLQNYRNHVVLIAAEPDQMPKVHGLMPALTVRWPRIGLIVPAALWLMPHMPGSILLSEETMLLWARNPLSQRVSIFLKRSVDIAGGVLGLAVFSPIFLLVALQGLFSGEAPFYGHRRVGRFGRPFTCLKFRTMVPNAAELLEELLDRDPAARREWQETYKLKNDPRVTRLGRFLRRTSLDELPQLWNVVRGEMSLVGPRPIVRDELRYYGDQAETYLTVKPGLTGAWQVSGRNDTSYQRRVSLDRWYVSHWCLWYDVVIMFKTISVMLGRRGAY